MIKTHYNKNGILILHGHVLDVLKKIPSESVQMCVTSPPYWGLRNYETNGQIWDGDKNCEHEWENKTVLLGSYFCNRCGAWKGELGLEPTPELYVKHIVDIFREIKRVLRHDGIIWVNIGDTYCGTGHKGKHKDPKNINGRNAQSVAINNKIKGLKRKDLVGIPWMIAFALRADGWWLRQDIIWHRENCMPSPVIDRCNTSHEYVFLLSKSAKYYFDYYAIQEPCVSSQKEINRQRKTDTKEKQYASSAKHSGGIGYGVNGRRKRSVWNINTKPYKGSHFAVFPAEFVETCIKAGASNNCCKKCGTPYKRIISKESQSEWQQICKCDCNEIKSCTILDPFLGSGTTAMVAKKKGLKCIGIDLNDNYGKLQTERIESGK